MAVTVEKRPIGVVLGTCVSATINQDYATAYATVNKTSHGLSDGNYVYIQSNVENYNGFWIIDVINANEFLLRDSPYVAWVVNADITYCPQSSTHGWSAVHLPITYELSNTRWPSNTNTTANPIQTIGGITNDYGYVKLTLTGDVGHGSLGIFEDLAFVEITNAPNPDFNGVYQIIDKLDENIVVINLAYSAITIVGLAGGNAQLYYPNYTVVVNVYGGLNSSHVWADQKPYELLDTLYLTPDENNRVKFSINEVLKKHIETSNNTLQPSLPNNLDYWTQFYIETGESYDTSDGYTVTTLTSGMASDQANFEGYAVNAKLEFKNIHSGFMSEYLMNNSAGKFLTLFDTPVLFSGYQDISFILPSGYVTVFFREQFYINGTLSATINTAINNSDDGGLFRHQLTEANCTYDRVDVTLVSGGSPISETKQFDINCDCSNQDIKLVWLTNLGGPDYWTFTAESEHGIDIRGTGETSVNIFPNWPSSYGEFADTEKRKQTFRDSAKKLFVTSQYLTQSQADAVAFIKSSVLVQISGSRQDRRTVIVDADSFVKYADGDKTFTISFNILYTDDIPSQRV